MVSRKTLLFIALLLPLLAMAQTSGGQISRPVKKQVMTSTTTQAKKQMPKKTSPSVSDKNHVSSVSSLNPILQRLIDNMVRVDGGTFSMGATPEQGNDAEIDEIPVHQVTLSSYSIGKYEVTQEEWVAVMSSNPSSFKGAKRPVENVSWNDCQEFIRKLNDITGKQFRLPTEAEWEYAARGGNRCIGYKYAGSDNLDIVAWHYGNSGCTTHEVGQKRANELGLFDMSGNVREWCQDWKGSYRNSPQTNPTGAKGGSFRVFRGGCWTLKARDCRQSTRNGNEPSYSYSNLGLRLAL